MVALQSRQRWNEKYKNVFLAQFSASVQSMEPTIELCLQETKTFLPFSTTYFYDAGFSALAIIKTKYRKQLQPEDNLRCALTTIKPNFD